MSFPSERVGTAHKAHYSDATHVVNSIQALFHRLLEGWRHESDELSYSVMLSIRDFLSRTFPQQPPTIAVKLTSAVLSIFQCDYYERVR